MRKQSNHLLFIYKRNILLEFQGLSSRLKIHPRNLNNIILTIHYENSKDVETL